jgi:hypothetical protein
MCTKTQFAIIKPQSIVEHWLTSANYLVQCELSNDTWLGICIDVKGSSLSSSSSLILEVVCFLSLIHGANEFIYKNFEPHHQFYDNQ